MKKNARTWPLFLMIGFASTVVIKSLNKGMWPIILSVSGLVGFLVLSIFILTRKKNQSKKSSN